MEKMRWLLVRVKKYIIFANCKNRNKIIYQNTESEKSYIGIIKVWHPCCNQRGAGVVPVEECGLGGHQAEPEQ